MSINYEMQAVNFVILFMWVCQKWGINLGMHNFYKYVVFIIAISGVFFNLGIWLSKQDGIYKIRIL